MTRTTADRAVVTELGCMSKKLWWLSFCNPDLPKGRQFLGACIVPASNIADAARVARAAGCNPGGEVVGCETEPDNFPLLTLMSSEDVNRYDAEADAIRSIVEEEDE